MPVEFTPEEKTKVQAYLAELGYDEHAKDVIAKIQAESKSHREAREALEKEFKATADTVKALEKEKSEREAAQKKKDDEEAARRKKEEDEKKTLDERLADVRAEIASQFEKTTKEQQAELKALTKQIEERDKKIEARDKTALVREVKNAAKLRGIIDTDPLDYLDLKDIKIVDGEPDYTAIEAVLAKHQESKPYLYTAAAARAAALDVPTGRPVPGVQPTRSGVDFSKLSDEDFAAKEAELRSVRV